VQETLTDAAYYAQPIGVTVSLGGCAAQLDVQIQDDGKGFNATDAPLSVGPLSVRERARTVGCGVLIDSSLGNGTRISLEYPREWRALRVAPRSSDSR
jgi:signal transduction histidine kinase